MTMPRGESGFSLSLKVMPNGLDSNHAKGMSGHVQQKVSRFFVSIGRLVKCTTATNAQMMTDANIK